MPRWNVRWAPLLALSAAACSAAQLAPLALIKPTVQLHHLGLRNVGLTGGTLDVVLAFYNPNRFTLRGSRLQAGVDIEGTHFGDAELAGPLSLADHDTTLVTAPLTFEWRGLGAAARSIVNSGAVSYQLKGTVSVDTPIGQ